MSGPTLNIIAGRYFAAIVYVDCPSSNFLGAAWRDPGGRWTLSYRVRLYVDAVAVGSRDVKLIPSERELSAGTDERHARIELRKIALAYSLDKPDPCMEWLEPASDDPRQIAALLLTQRWAHVSAAPPPIGGRS